MEEKIVYFESGGKDNTEATLKLAKERAIKKKIENVVVASGGGFSAEKALVIFKGTNVKVTIVTLGSSTAPSRFSENTKEQLKQRGYNLIFSGDINYEYPAIAVTAYRRFSEGTKVCVNVMLAAADAGFIPVGKEIVAVGGSGTSRGTYAKGGGADTAVVIEVMKSSEFFKLEDTPAYPKDERRKIKEIICKPR